MARTAEAAVISLADHPAWQSAQRRSEEFLEAMRRHPSYVARTVTAEVSPAR